MRILKRLLNPRAKPVIPAREPVLMENTPKAAPPDQSLEDKAKKLQRELSHGYMVMNSSQNVAISALRQMDRSRGH